VAAKPGRERGESVENTPARALCFAPGANLWQTESLLPTVFDLAIGRTVGAVGRVATVPAR